MLHLYAALCVDWLWALAQTFGVISLICQLVCLETGAVRRAPAFDESSVDADDHLFGRFIRFSVLGNFPLNLFVYALPIRVDSTSVGGMGSSAHRWEEHSE